MTGGHEPCSLLRGQTVETTTQCRGLKPAAGVAVELWVIKKQQHGRQRLHVGVNVFTTEWQQHASKSIIRLHTDWVHGREFLRDYTCMVVAINGTSVTAVVVLVYNMACFGLHM